MCFIPNIGILSSGILYKKVWEYGRDAGSYVRKFNI